MVAIAEHIAAGSFPFKFMLCRILIAMFTRLSVIRDFTLADFPFKHFYIVHIGTQLKNHVKIGDVLFNGKFCKNSISVIAKKVLKIGDKLPVRIGKIEHIFLMEKFPIEFVNTENIFDVYLSQSQVHIIAKKTPIADTDDIAGNTVVFGVDAGISLQL